MIAPVGGEQICGIRVLGPLIRGTAPKLHAASLKPPYGFGSSSQSHTTIGETITTVDLLCIIYQRILKAEFPMAALHQQCKTCVG